MYILKTLLNILISSIFIISIIAIILIILFGIFSFILVMFAVSGTGFLSAILFKLAISILILLTIAVLVFSCVWGLAQDIVDKIFHKGK